MKREAAVVLELPIKTGRGQNDREHWAVRAKRVKIERKGTAWVVKTTNRPALPCKVTVTRLSAGVLDGHDNLAGSLKAIVDGIADAFGVADNDQRLQFVYKQEKCKRGKYGVRIELEPA